MTKTRIKTHDLTRENAKEIIYGIARKRITLNTGATAITGKLIDSAIANGEATLYFEDKLGLVYDIIVDESFLHSATLTIEIPPKALPETKGTLIYITAVDDLLGPEIRPNTPFLQFLDDKGNPYWRDILGAGHVYYPHAILDYEIIQLPDQENL